MTSTETLAERLMKNEDITNGIWNHLLSTAFPFPKFLVVPEYQFDAHGDRGYADLAVLKINDLGKDNHQIVLLYEGKKAGGDWAKIADAAAQAKRAMAGRKSGETPYILIALGSAFGFLKHDLTNVDGFLKGGDMGKNHVTGSIDATDGKTSNFARVQKKLGDYASKFS